MRNSSVLHEKDLIYNDSKEEDRVHQKPGRYGYKLFYTHLKKSLDMGLNFFGGRATGKRAQKKAANLDWDWPLLLKERRCCFIQSVRKLNIYYTDKPLFNHCFADNYMHTI